jgi:hypothetical protein
MIEQEHEHDLYQLVIIDCPYDTWSNQLTRDLFADTIQLKLDGYLASYPYGALPVDTTDFIGTHHIVCEKKNGSLVPVMAYKTTALTRCKIHNLTFPALSLMQAAGAKKHAEEVMRIIAAASENQHEISYDGSWTMDPAIRRDKTRSEYLKKIMTAINVQYHISSHVPEILGLGLLRFKTEQYFKNIGYRQLSQGDQLLPPISMGSLQNESVVLMHLTEFTKEALATAQEFNWLWEKRIEISDHLAANRIGSSRKAA